MGTLSREDIHILAAGGNLPGTTPPPGHDPLSPERQRFLREQQARQPHQRVTGEVAVASLVYIRPTAETED